MGVARKEVVSMKHLYLVCTPEFSFVAESAKLASDAIIASIIAVLGAAEWNSSIDFAIEEFKMYDRVQISQWGWRIERI